jgi:predicted acyl esterase
MAPRMSLDDERLIMPMLAEGRPMSLKTSLAAFVLAMLSTSPVVTQSPPRSAAPALPADMPGQFRPVTDTFDYVKRDVMIPMRDGVKLHTIVLIPRGAAHAPILLTRTPYEAKTLTGHAASAHLGPILSGYDNATEVIVEGGYIRVVQDVRGKYDSEGGTPSSGW